MLEDSRRLAKATCIIAGFLPLPSGGLCACDGPPEGGGAQFSSIQRSQRRILHEDLRSAVEEGREVRGQEDPMGKYRRPDRERREAGPSRSTCSLSEIGMAGSQSSRESPVSKKRKRNFKHQSLYLPSGLPPGGKVQGWSSYTTRRNST
jgi:hypothetical protein